MTFSPLRQSVKRNFTIYNIELELTDYTGGYILNRAMFANTVAMMKAIITEILTLTLHFDA